MVNFVSFLDCQVVEIVDRYDHDCVPPDFSQDKLKFIQSSSTNKTCDRKLTVSSNSLPLFYSKMSHFRYFYFSCLFLCAKMAITVSMVCVGWTSGTKGNEKSRFYLLPAWKLLSESSPVHRTLLYFAFLLIRFLP